MDLDRLRKIAKDVGPFQIIYAGKAHPKDGTGKDIVRHIFRAKRALKKSITVVFLDNYDLDLGGLMTSGSDLWLNTPMFPLEASGTSGMKAAVNGVPSLSILDGWWVEGHIEGVTGWAIGPLRKTAESSADNPEDAESLYSKLESAILPMFYHDRNRYLNVMQHAIAINGSYFNTHRMVEQYITDAYFG
jgi:starch phosphorylase